jgi:hypothetical protein
MKIKTKLILLLVFALGLFFLIGSSYAYYQLSLDKYTSYLMYGNTSTHPNYSGKAKEIENDECVGPKNDDVTTSYSSQE